MYAANCTVLIIRYKNNYKWWLDTPCRQSTSIRLVFDHMLSREESIVKEPLDFRGLPRFLFRALLFPL